MMLHIPQLLTAEELTSLKADLATAPWRDGGMTAGAQAGKLKKAEQLPYDEPLNQRLSAIVAASVALTTLPIAFGPQHIERLHAVGLDDAAIADLIGAASFFNWANRLMLSLGEPATQG